MAEKKDAASERLQKEVDKATEQGFMGVEVDPTPNEEYSLESDSWKVPEADPEAAAKVGSSRFTGGAAFPAGDES